MSSFIVGWPGASFCARSILQAVAAIRTIPISVMSRSGPVYKRVETWLWTAFTILVIPQSVAAVGQWPAMKPFYAKKSSATEDRGTTPAQCMRFSGPCSIMNWEHRNDQHRKVPPPRWDNYAAGMGFAGPTEERR